MSLNLARNGVGPTVMGSLSLCLGRPNCTLTDLDVSDNPLGYSAKNGGLAREAAVDMRQGFSAAKSLQRLSLSRTAFLSAELVCKFSYFPFCAVSLLFGCRCLSSAAWLIMPY